MAKTVKFKNPDSRMQVAGFGVIDKDNLNWDRYQYLLSLSPAHADQFIVSDEPEAKAEVKPKSNKNESSIQA